MNKYSKPSYGTCILVCENYKGEQQVEDFLSEIKPIQSPKLPPLKTRFENFTRSMGRVYIHLKKTGELLVPRKKFNERIEICKSNICKKFNSKRMSCAECGCKLGRKLALAASNCPLDYWKES